MWCFFIHFPFFQVVVVAVVVVEVVMYHFVKKGFCKLAMTKNTKDSREGRGIGHIQLWWL